MAAMTPEQREKARKAGFVVGTVAPRDPRYVHQPRQVNPPKKSPRR